MNVEKMTLRDVEAVHQLGKDQQAFHVSGDDAFWSIAQLKSWVKRDEDVLLIARDQGHIVGFALSTLHGPTGKATWENLYVVPQCRGQGIGASLGDKLIKQLQEKGATYVCFFVRTDNTEEIEYFQKRGFKRGFDFVWFGKNP